MSKTKYVVYDNGALEDMIIFSTFECHADVVKKGRLKVVSAGFVKIIVKNGKTEAECYGDSFTLKLSSRDKDSEIANRVLGLD